MHVPLADVSITDTPPGLLSLDWVGMQGIDLPIEIAEPGYRRQLHARVDAQVNLPAAHVKGIHMSRLYRLLDGAGERSTLSPDVLASVLHAMVDSHRDCETTGARLRFGFALLARRPALLSEGLAGWKAYPVRIDASLHDRALTLQARVTVQYSSTCPCSAALSRQWIAQRFEAAFAARDTLHPAEVAEWLLRHGTAATPHSQRSEATVRVTLPEDAPHFGLLSLIEQIEQAVGTPVQTAVKRADEQAFAVLNGANLMFVEDAARRIEHALRQRFAAPQVFVRHLESLHPHDAVAWASAPSDGAVA